VRQVRWSKEGVLMNDDGNCVTNWTPVARPTHRVLSGSTVRLQPIVPQRDAHTLFDASHDAGDPSLWDYLPVGPFPDEAGFTAWLASVARSEDPLFLAVVDERSGDPSGMVSFMRLAPEHGVIEIGFIWFGPSLQRTRQATEAIYLLARHAFDDLGYRRLEWKCNARNERSRRAALRFGFTYEGIFRQHMVVKNRSRDTAWFSIIDREWPAIRAAFEAWLLPNNFDSDGRQRQSLMAIREHLYGNQKETVMNALDPTAALIIVDVQDVFKDPQRGRRNNPDAEAKIARLLHEWRRTRRPIFFIRHLSPYPTSPFHVDNPASKIMEIVRPIDGEPVIEKSVNSAFIGTDLEERLRRAGITTLVITGLTTNHCVETTTRMAGNLGFDTYLVVDATAAYDLLGPDGVLHTAEDIQSMTIANLHGEFATIVYTDEVITRSREGAEQPVG
jgi:RimJ/RimL family protein N-acetyltransferase/nicotinamidase-related amidase